MTDGADADAAGRTDRQRQAVDTAAGVFDRLVEEAAAAPPRLPVGSPSAGFGARPGRSRAQDGLAAAVSLFSDVMLRIVDGYADLTDRAGGSDTTPPGTPVTLRGTPGRVAVGSVWIHNLTSDPVPSIGLRLTRLTAHDGTELDPAAVFEPPELAVAAEASAHSVLAVPLPADVAGGIYHGHVLGSGHPDTALPVRLVVEP